MAMHVEVPVDGETRPCAKQHDALARAFAEARSREALDGPGCVHWLGVYLAHHARRLLVMTVLEQVPARVAGGDDAYCHARAAAEALTRLVGVVPPDVLQPARWFAVRRLLGSLGTPRDRRQVLALTKAIEDWREHLPASASEERFERWRAERRAARARRVDQPPGPPDQAAD